MLLGVIFILLFLLYKQTYSSPTSAKSEVEVKAIVLDVIQNIATGNVELAKEKSLGVLLFNLNNTEREQNGHLVVKSDVETITVDEDWARARVTIETINPRNEADVHWYDVYLVKKDGEFKAFKIIETEPVFTPGKVDDDEIDLAVQAFGNFINYLAENNYTKAGELLIGKARNLHEQTESLFKDTLIFERNGVKIKNIEPLSGDSKNIVLNVKYELNGRDLEAVVSYYKASGEWKIHDISQI